MKTSFHNLKKDVIDKGLCTSCGACKGICPNSAIDFIDKENRCVPYLEGSCIQCGMCQKVCVGAGFDVNSLKSVQSDLYGTKQEEEDNSYYICHAKDPLIWKNSASGGFVTSALIYALDNRIIEYAAVIKNDSEKPWLPKVNLVNTREGIVDAMQSKYCVVPTLEILQQIKKVNAPVAMVLLPCQAQAFMNIRHSFPNLFRNVVLTIGVMCGNSLPFEATNDVLNHIGVNNTNDIIDLKYRDGLWHGDLHVRLKNGEEKGVPYTHYMRYMGDFYRKERCKLCIDGDAMFTDVSSGDGWIPGRKQDNVYGWSIVHTHTRTGEKLFSEMCKNGLLDVISITEQQAHNMKHMYKRFHSSIPRIEYKKRKGMPVPVYTGLCVPNSLISEMNLRKKMIVDLGQKLLFSKVSRSLLRPIPLRFKSLFLEKLLKIWFNEK